MSSGEGIHEPSGYTIFCDDIRTEIDGRFTFVGVLPGALGFENFPATVAKFAVSITYREPRDYDTTTVELRLIYEPIDGDAVTLISSTIDTATTRAQFVESQGEAIVSLANVVLAPFTFAEPGTLKVRAFAEGKEPVRLGGLLVRAASELQLPQNVPMR